MSFKSPLKATCLVRPTLTTHIKQPPFLSPQPTLGAAVPLVSSRTTPPPTDTAHTPCLPTQHGPHDASSDPDCASVMSPYANPEPHVCHTATSASEMVRAGHLPVLQAVSVLTWPQPQLLRGSTHTTCTHTDIDAPALSPQSCSPESTADPALCIPEWAPQPALQRRAGGGRGRAEQGSNGD